MKFFLWSQRINSFIIMRKMNLLCPIIKREEIVMWISVYPNWKRNMNSKNGRNSCFSYEAEASISFIPIRSMCLWCLIVKRKEMIIWIYVRLNQWTNINSKSGRKIRFSYETKASISLILMTRICLWCPILKSKDIIM